MNDAIPDALCEDIADYLTDGMDAGRRQAFELRLSREPELARAVDDLRRTQDLVASVRANELPARRAAAGRSMSFRRFAVAAMVGMSFCIGYVVRDVTHRPPSQGQPVIQVARSTAGIDREAAVIQVLQSTNADSDLARSLAVFAAIAHRKHEP